MRITELQRLHQEIKEKLFETAYKIECFNKTGDLDINRYAETYFRYILNILYQKDGWYFEKPLKINQDTYDLYDLKNRVCVQITSNNLMRKKASTIDQFKQKHFEKFDTLIILFISKSKPTKLIATSGFNFIDLDIPELCGLIESRCEIDDLIKIRNVLLPSDTQESDLRINGNKRLRNRRIFINYSPGAKTVEKELLRKFLRDSQWIIAAGRKLCGYVYLKFKDG